MSNGSATVTMEESPDAAVVVRLAHPYRLIEWDSMLERVLGAELAADAIAAAGLADIASPLSARRLSELFMRLSQKQQLRRQLTFFDAPALDPAVV